MTRGPRPRGRHKAHGTPSHRKQRVQRHWGERDSVPACSPLTEHSCGTSCESGCRGNSAEEGPIGARRARARLYLRRQEREEVLLARGPSTEKWVLRGSLWLRYRKSTLPDWRVGPGGLACCTSELQTPVGGGGVWKVPGEGSPTGPPSQAHLPGLFPPSSTQGFGR